MSNTIQYDSVVTALGGSVTPAQAQDILERIKAEELKLKAEDEKEKAPRVKNQFVILVSDPEGRFEGVDAVGWVFQMPEDDAVQTLQGKILKSIGDFNQTKKGRRMPAATMGDAIESIPAKIFKEHGISAKTKQPVLLLTTPNDIGALLQAEGV
jgi:hypothetical protein